MHRRFALDAFKTDEPPGRTNITSTTADKRLKSRTIDRPRAFMIDHPI